MEICESANRYSLIIETFNDNKYCYNAEKNCFVLLNNSEKEYKGSLATIDYLTSSFETIADFASVYGINDDVKKIYIKYIYKGDNYLAPVFNNKTWHDIAYSYNGKEINFKNQTNIDAFNDVYLELTNRNSSFAQYVMDNENKQIKVCQKTMNEIVSLVAHERAIEKKIENYCFIKEPLYLSDKGGFYMDLRKRLSNYRDFRSIYLNYCRFVNKKNEINKNTNNSVKKKVLIPPQQISMFD